MNTLHTTGKTSVDVQPSTTERDVKVSIRESRNIISVDTSIGDSVMVFIGA